MKKTRLFQAIVIAGCALGAVAGGCGPEREPRAQPDSGPGHPTVDAGITPDGGHHPAGDAGTDGGVDAGLDAGDEPDAGELSDAGEHDAGWHTTK